MATRPPTLAIVAAVAAMLVAGVGCKRRAAEPELTALQLRQLSAGISAMPPSVVAVLRIDVPVVAQSPVMAAVAAAVVKRNGDAGAAVARLGGKCGTDLAWLGELVIGIGARQDNGTYPTVLAVQSLLPAVEFIACMEALVGSAGTPTSMTAPMGQEAVLGLGEGTSRVWMVTTGAGTRGSQWLVANQEAMLVESLAAARGGANVLSNTLLAPQLVSAGQGNLPLWAAGLVPSGFASRMRLLTNNRVSTGPSAFVLRIGLREGLSVHLLAKLASVADANELKILVNSEIGALAMAAQVWGLGPYVSSIAVEAAGPMLILKAAYSAGEVQELLAAIDNPGANQQDAAPTLGVPHGAP